MDRYRSIQHIFLRTRRRVLLRCGQSAWVGYQRPKCMWLALLAIQLWFAEHKQYGVLTIPIAATVGKADGKFWDYDDGVVSVYEWIAIKYEMHVVCLLGALPGRKE